jgi:hypothetical protein
LESRQKNASLLQSPKPLPSPPPETSNESSKPDQAIIHSKTFTLAPSHLPDLLKKQANEGPVPDYVFKLFPPELEAKPEFQEFISGKYD